MKALAIIVAVVILVIGAGAWWYTSGKDAARESSASPTATEESDSIGNTVDENEDEVAATITYTDAGFSTSTETVRTGSRVLVVNDSSATLQFSSDPHPQHTDNPELNLPTLRPGEQETMMVSETGSWGFHNHLNDNHFGSLIVTD